MIKQITLVLFAVCFYACWAHDPFSLPEKPPLHLSTIALHYTDATQLAQQINQKAFHLLSPLGYVRADKKNNLWVYDDNTHLASIRKMLKQFDQPPPQIYIKAHIAIIDQHSMNQLGAYLKTLSLNGAKQDGDNYLPLPLLHLANQNLIEVKLTALEQKGHASIISEPELITQNNKTAIIASGDEIPYQEKTGRGNTNVTFKKAVLQLQVTPTVLPQQRIQLKLSIHQDKPGELLAGGIPAITTQQLSTQVTVHDQQTLVLGGIHAQTNHQQRQRVPLLGKLPLLGWLFGHKKTEQNQQQLFIAITPHIL